MAKPTDIYDELTPSGEPRNLLDELIDRRQRLSGPFPTNAGGTLINPDYIQKEGQRIRDSLAAGTYGSGTTASTPPGAVTVVSPSSPGDGQAPTVWEQSAWNQDEGALRRDLNFDILRTTAAQRKLDLEQSTLNAPVLSAYEQAKLAHEQAATSVIGETQAFHQAQDAQSMQHVTGFAKHMAGAPPVNSPEYAPYVLQGVMKFPRMATTEWGKGTLGKLAQEHDTIAGLTSKLPPGFDLSTVSVGADGKPRVTFKPTDADKALEKAAKGYGLTLDQVRNPVGAVVGRRDKAGQFVQDNSGDIVRLKNKENHQVDLSAKEYERLGGTYSGETAKARGSAPAVDLNALARKALDDPNAPENVRAAARKRLGK